MNTINEKPVEALISKPENAATGRCVQEDQSIGILHQTNNQIA